MLGPREGGRRLVIWNSSTGRREKCWFMQIKKNRLILQKRLIAPKLFDRFHILSTWRKRGKQTAASITPCQITKLIFSSILGIFKNTVSFYEKDLKIVNVSSGLKNRWKKSHFRCQALIASNKIPSHAFFVPEKKKLSSFSSSSTFFS